MARPRITRKAIARTASMGARAASMASRFIFISAAAIFLPAEDLGRFGVLTAMAVLVTNIVGLEMYQPVNRAIANDTAPAGERARYAAFALCGAVVAGCSSVVILSWMGWAIDVTLLGAAVIASEHAGTELFRMLVIERKSNAALVSFSLRSGAWALALPALTLTGAIGRGWTLEQVLIWWLASSALGNAMLVALPRAYRFNGHVLAQVPGWAWRQGRSVLLWLTVATCWRLLENGGRLISGMVLGYAATGRFTLLNTISVLALNLQKGFVEPIMFSELSRPGAAAARRSLMRRALALGLLGVLGGLAALGSYQYLGHIRLGTTDVLQFAGLSLLSVTLMVSQPYHFHLYSEGKDRQVLFASLVAVIVGVPMAAAGAMQFGPLGLAFGLATGGVMMLLSKATASRRLGRDLAFDARRRWLVRDVGDR